MIKAISGIFKYFPMTLQISIVAYVGVLFLFGKDVFQIHRPDLVSKDELGASKVGNSPIKHNNISHEDKNIRPPTQDVSLNATSRIDKGFILLADRKGKSPFHTNKTLGEYAAEKAFGYKNAERTE